MDETITQLKRWDDMSAQPNGDGKHDQLYTIWGVIRRPSVHNLRVDNHDPLCTTWGVISLRGHGGFTTPLGPKMTWHLCTLTKHRPLIMASESDIPWSVPPPYPDYHAHVWYGVTRMELTHCGQFPGSDLSKPACQPQFEKNSENSFCIKPLHSIKPRLNGTEA